MGNLQDGPRNWHSTNEATYKDQQSNQKSEHHCEISAKSVGEEEDLFRSKISYLPTNSSIDLNDGKRATESATR
jgi:hypothetical protein